MAENPLVEIFTELAVAWLVILFRVFARSRHLGFKKLQVDDYLMVFAGCIYAGEATCAYFVGYFKGLSIADMTDEQRATLDPNSVEWDDRVKGSKTFIAGWMTYTSLLWTLKTCILIFYSRLTANIHITNMKLRLRIATIALAVTYVGIICVVLFACSPMHKHWQINPNPGAECHSANAKSNMYTMLIFNVLTDMYLIYIPIPVIWRAQLGRKRQIGLTTLFAGAIITTIFGFLRCIIVLTTPGIQGANLAGLWSIRESFIAIVVTNIPLVFPYVNSLWHSLAKTTSSTLKGSSKSNHHLPPHHNSGAATFPKSKPDTTLSKTLRGKIAGGGRNPYSLPGGDESVERIVKYPATTTTTQFSGKGGDARAGFHTKINRGSETDIEMSTDPWHSLDREGMESTNLGGDGGGGAAPGRIQVTTSVQVDRSRMPGQDRDQNRQQQQDRREAEARGW